MSRKVSFAEGLRLQFSTKSLVLIPIAVGINLIGGTLCSVLKLPLFLDTIGTLIVATLSGPWVAALTGLLTNVFLALVANPVYLPYSIVSILVGLTVGYMAKAGLFNKVWGVVLIWLVCSFVNSVSASLITTFVFGGATGANGTSVLTAAFLVAMQDVLLSVLSSAFIENMIDKGITVLIAYMIYRKIPRRFISQYAASGFGADDSDDDADDIDAGR